MLDRCLLDNKLRPGEVGLRARPRKKGESFEDVLDDLLERALNFNGTLQPGDIYVDANGDEVVVK